MLVRLHYDNVFHQHLRYYSVRSLNYLFHQFGMEVFDVERSEVYGGSIRVFSGHLGAHPISPRVQELLEVEERAGLYDSAAHQAFARAIEDKKRKLFDAVYQRVSAGKKVIGIGAPAKASTVANYCGLTRDMISYITEVNPLRVGKYLPGVHIPIVAEEFMFQDPQPPDVGLLFAWNYYDEVVPKLRARGFHGEVLCP